VTSPFQVVKDFERSVADYTGAPYVVAVRSATDALYLSLLWCVNRYLGHDYNVNVPKRTYPSVPMAVKRAGFNILFTDDQWEGVYNLAPTPVWDCAKRFSSRMYVPSQFQCVSFHPQKLLSLSSGGGAILHDDHNADAWFRKMRFDGRTEGVPTKDDKYTMIGEHCYMFPGQAAEGLHRLSIYVTSVHPDQPADLENYPDLSKHEVFRW